MNDKIYDTIIIGSGPAGMNAALYGARGSLDILILDKSGYGGTLNDTALIENYLGFEDVSGEELSDKMFEQISAYENIQHEFAEIKTIIKEKDLFKVIDDEGNIYTSVSLIIATGVKHKKIGLANESKFEKTNISFCAACDGFFYKGKDIVVVGGGNSALEEALYLSDIVNSVTLIHRRDEFRGDKIAQQRVFKKDNINIIWNSEIVALNGVDKMESLTLLENKKDLTEFKTDGLFEYIGVVPTSDLFKSLNVVDEEGYIPTNSDMETSIKGVFAVGDIRTNSKRQIATAVGDGAIAGLSIRNYVETFKD